MAEQVNPVGSLASGLPLALLVASTNGPANEKARPAKAPDPPASKPDSRPAAESVESPVKAMERLNDHLQQTHTELKFQVDRDSGRTLFQIVSEKTGEVLLQVPSEEVLAMARKLREFQQQMGASGVLMDKQG
jgi:flagellar protein FlaG